MNEIKDKYEEGNKVLEDSKNKFDFVVVVGLKENGFIDINTHLPQYQFLNWILNRALFELLIHEKNEVINNNKEGQERLEV